MSERVPLIWATSPGTIRLGRCRAQGAHSTVWVAVGSEANGFRGLRGLGLKGVGLQG